MERDAFGLESRKRLVKSLCCFSVGARTSVIHGKARLVCCTSHHPPIFLMFAVDEPVILGRFDLNTRSPWSLISPCSMQTCQTSSEARHGRVPCSIRHPDTKA